MAQDQQQRAYYQALAKLQKPYQQALKPLPSVKRETLEYTPPPLDDGGVYQTYADFYLVPRVGRRIGEI